MTMRPDDRARPDAGTGQKAASPTACWSACSAFLLGLTVLVWTATGLAGLLRPRRLAAGRHLHPHPAGHAPPGRRSRTTSPGAWPDTPAAQLSGYGLFWGLFIGQLMVLVVLTVFVLGTVARWRAVRAARRARRRTGTPARTGTGAGADARRSRAQPEPRNRRTGTGAAHGGGAHDGAPPKPATRRRRTDSRDPLTHPPGSHARPAARHPRRAAALVYGPTRNPPPHRDPGRTRRGGPRPGRHLQPHPLAGDEGRPSQTRPRPPLRPHPPLRHPGPPPLVPHRRLRGQAHGGRSEPPPCSTPVRPTAKIDQAIADTAETLLRSYLHAAAMDGRTFRHVHRWAQGTQRPGRRTHPPYAPQGRLRRGRRTRSRAHRPPRTPGHRPGVDGPGPLRALHGQHPRGLHARTELTPSPWIPSSTKGARFMWSVNRSRTPGRTPARCPC